MTLFTLAEDLTKLRLWVYVDEADVSVVKVGQAATFTVSAYLSRQFPARITRVGFGSTITDNVVFVYWIFYALSVASALKFAPPTEGYRAPMRGLLVGVFVTGAIMLVVSQIIQAPQASAQALIILIPGLILSYWYGNAEAEDTESD